MIRDNFAYFSIKTYVVGTHYICFYGEITKNICHIHSLSVSLTVMLVIMQ